MRSYFFGNYYLSSIQQGIQAAHCVADMFVEYGNIHTTPQQFQLYDWAEHHKTMVLLNGGNQASIIELATFFDSPNNPFPWASFNEDFESLNNCVTTVGIVLPERIYETASLIRSRKAVILRIEGEEPSLITSDGIENDWTFTAWEMELMEKLNQYGLAK